MIIYRIENGVEPYHYEGTKSAAHKWAKDNVDKAQWPDVKIAELGMQTDKEGIVALANNSPIMLSENAAWGLTKRGGLEEWKE